VNPIQQQGRARARPCLSWTIAEVVAWTAGILLLFDGGARYIAGLTGSRQAMEQFAGLKAAATKVEAVDLTLWSPERIEAWRRTLSEPGPAPLAVLRIPRIRIEVPVLEGTDEVTLNRAVGHIDETAVPGADGNAGIAGHRDGFFRGLKDIKAGDVIELETLHRHKQIYRVERTWIVDPEDVSVLDATPVRSLTLVTCYPFYFIGSAPQRFIVRAVLAEAVPTLP
jgi:sortase A